jgi:hypothetical protein
MDTSHASTGPASGLHRNIALHHPGEVGHHNAFVRGASPNDLTSCMAECRIEVGPVGYADTMVAGSL